MIWNLIGLAAAGSFFYVGLSILSDPLCQSVSFQGGGARTIATTCMPDGSGDFSRSAAISLLFLGGTILFGFMFRNYLIRIYRELRFQYVIQRENKKLNPDSSVGQQEELISFSAGNKAPKINSILNKNKNILIVGVILVLALPTYKVIAPKIGFLNSITCASLKSSLAEKDLLGREIWNSYQNEVSNLARVEQFSNQYYLQVGNIARRAIQLETNDLQGYEMLKAKPHCVKDIKLLTTAIDSTTTSLRYLSGVGMIDGKKFDVYSGWNTDYYNAYFDFNYFLK